MEEMGCKCGCNCGYSAKNVEGTNLQGGEKLSRAQKIMIARMVATVVMVVALHFVPVVGAVKFLLYLIPYLFMGYDILLEAWEGIRRGQIFDVNFLMSVATVGALVLGLTSTGEYTEAVAVMLFYQLGEWFEGFALEKSRRNISQLMDIRPDYANIEENGQLKQVPPEPLAVGTIIVVQPGEKIPLDGVIVEGNSSLDTVALTGESLPRDVVVGDEVLSGCINLRGNLKVRTTREFGQSTVAKIMALVEEAGERKSRPEAFITKFARIYTPLVCYGALALFLLPPLVRILFWGMEAEWSLWLYRSLTFLVISCPCALVISIPLAFFAGIGGASHQGILIKGSNFMESLAKTTTLVFDKTGTLTQGKFTVVEVRPAQGLQGSQGLEEAKELLEYAALAESSSSHPISKGIVAAYGKNPDRSLVSEVQEWAGQGLVATVKGQQVAVGNEKLMESILGKNWKAQEMAQLAGTQVHVAINGIYRGYLILADKIKDTAPVALQKLKKLGVTKTVMLTGDNGAVAQAVAGQLGISQVESQLLPGDKVAKVEELLAGQKDGAKLAFVGDGINDAPVLSRSDVGIAMGGLGSDAAIEAADVVLMDDNLEKIPKAIQLSRKTLGIAHQNIVFALGVKFSCMILGAMGITTMWLAIFADVGVMVLAVLNAIRGMKT